MHAHASFAFIPIGVTRYVCVWGRGDGGIYGVSGVYGEHPAAQKGVTSMQNALQLERLYEILGNAELSDREVADLLTVGVELTEVEVEVYNAELRRMGFDLPDPDPRNDFWM